MKWQAQVEQKHRDFFEPRIGVNFGCVNIHNDDQAVNLQQSECSSIHCRSDVAFGKGKYEPGTDNGRRLLAHELTHVVQQTGGTPKPQTTVPLTQSGPNAAAAESKTQIETETEPTAQARTVLPPEVIPAEAAPVESGQPATEANTSPASTTQSAETTETATSQPTDEETGTAATPITEATPETEQAAAPEATQEAIPKPRPMQALKRSVIGQKYYPLSSCS